MSKSLWGKTTDGADAHIYTLTSGPIEVRVTDFGAHLVSVRTPDRTGKVADVVLGFDTIKDYQTQPDYYLGALVGRFGNRIAKGQFTIDGKTYQIPLNDGANALHGGPVGFDKYLWKAEEVSNGVEFTHTSPDGDMGFPGTLTARIRYTLTGGTLRLDYSATTDKATVVNLTNHAYFNLRGDGEGDILGHRLQLDAENFTPTDSGLIPTGELKPVAGTPLDFRKPAVIGERIEADFEPLRLAGGYDHNFAVNGPVGVLRRAARMSEPASGRTLTVETTEPGIQFYAGNFLDGQRTGRHGQKIAKRTGFCLETQHFPDAPNHAEFASAVLRPGEALHSTTTFTFGVE